MKSITRNEAIELLRQKCKALVDEDHSLCEVASRENILCGGFAQWTFGELKKRHDWMIKQRPRITRAELEDLANRWQLARQFVSDTELACDNQIQEKHHQICRGWNEFSDEELEAFCKTMSGDDVSIEAEHRAKS